jgi:aspartyl-tRNA(Asn)/glutamyl-tRNA(Gln) amidotransferase subunit B
MLETGRRPADVAAEKNLFLEGDPSVIVAWVDQVLRENPQAWEDARKGAKNQKKAFGFLVGQIMKLSHRTASPEVVQRLLREKLGGKP